MWVDLSGGVKMPPQEERIPGARSSNLCSKIGMYNGIDKRICLVGVFERRGAVKTPSRGQTMERLVGCLTELRFHIWSTENESILSKASHMTGLAFQKESFFIAVWSGFKQLEEGKKTNTDEKSGSYCKSLGEKW